MGKRSNKNGGDDMSMVGASFCEDLGLEKMRLQFSQEYGRATGR